jgi:hypothetical protein
LSTRQLRARLDRLASAAGKVLARHAYCDLDRLRELGHRKHHAPDFTDEDQAELDALEQRECRERARGFELSRREDGDGEPLTTSEMQELAELRQYNTLFAGLEGPGRAWGAVVAADRLESSQRRRRT